MRGLVRRLTGILVLLLVSGTLGGGVAAQSAPRCFDETGFCIDGRIRDYWEQNGGLRVFGFPISEQRTFPIEGQPIEAQWFERNRLELHPENDPPYDVLLGRLGVDVLEQQGRDWQTFPTDGASQPGCRYFAATQQNVCDDILAAWRANGLDLGDPGISDAESLALFGLPISPLQEEEIGGETYQVQWFERARFELHPQNDPPFNVLLGRLSATVLEAAASEPAGTIAFVSDRDGNNEIYLMQPDGSAPRNLTQHPASDTWPAWSPDGSQLAFISDRDGNDELYVMRADGSGVRRLTERATPERQPAWSPDGTRIAFASDLGASTDIFVLRLDASNRPAPRNLTNAPAVNEAPAWSPDGTQIAFVSSRDDGEWEVYTMQADGSDQRNLTNTNLGDDRDPAWSPDGRRIAFVSTRDGSWDIFTMQADGSDQRQYTRTFSDEGHPAWSPDGAHLLYHARVLQAGQPPALNIYRHPVASPIGRDTTPRNLTQTPATDIQATWTPAQH
jgi:hypothetical protein